MICITAVVETPKGSAQKYDYDGKNNWFKLKKVMPAGMVFPFDFGFIPKTKGEDGDPLDIIIISELKSFPGCVVAEQTEKNKTFRNDRFIAIAEPSQTFAHVQLINDLPKDTLKQLVDFFVNYNEAAGKTFKHLKSIDAEEANELITNAKEI